jgi:hypothetical protein
MSSRRRGEREHDRDGGDQGGPWAALDERRPAPPALAVGVPRPLGAAAHAALEPAPEHAQQRRQQRQGRQHCHRHR